MTITATLDRKALIATLQPMTNIVARRNVIPMLDYVRIETVAGPFPGITITATDMHAAHTITIAAEPDPEFDTLVPLRDFLAWLKAQPGSTVNIAHDSKRQLDATACCDGATFPMNGLADYSGDWRTDWQALIPAKPDDAGDETAINIPLATFRDMLDKTRFAVSTEETRYYLNGTYLHTTQANKDAPHVLAAVATDGHRLSLYQTSIEIAEPAKMAIHSGMSCILPRYVTDLLLKISSKPKDGETISLRWLPHYATVAFRGHHITTKTVDGTFPDYTRVVPKDPPRASKAVITAKAADLISTAKRVTAGQPTNTIALDNMTWGPVAMQYASANHGAAAPVTFPAASTGPGIRCGINAKYLLDALAVFDPNETVRLTFDAEHMKLSNGEIDPRGFSAPFTITGDDHHQVRIAQMPMTVAPAAVKKEAAA